MTFSIGENVGPYRITDKLGQGGMATVYRAYHANLDRYVALKVLHTVFKEDPNFLARFRREAQIVARLEHPGIVPIYDYNEHNGEPYLVMRFIEGETLKARLARKPLTLEETLKIMTAVSQALTYAHEHGILHRDIKPSNILLEKGTEPFLADFGLARMASAGESTLSKDTMLGTPQYMSPEQAQGLQDLDAGTDIYSLGVVLYEVVVGRVPFNADTPYAIVHDHIYAPLPLPTSVNPQVPRAVERVLLKTLAKDRADRYRTAIEMVDAFRDAVRESDLKELSAASYRVASTGPLPSNQAAPPGVPPSSVSPAQAAVPPPAVFIPAPAPAASGMGSSAAQRYKQQQRRATLWRLGGFAGLVATFLLGMFVTVSAFSDTSIRAGLFMDRPATGKMPSPPGDESATPLSTLPAVALPPADNSDSTDSAENVATPAESATPGGMTLADAQQLVADHPNEPLAHFILGLLLFRDNKLLKGNQEVAEGFRLAKGDPAVLMRIAQQVSKIDGAYNSVALLTYSSAYALGTATTPAIRDEAGQYLYQYAQSPRNRRDSAVLKAIADVAANSQSAGLYALIAIGYQAANRPADARDALAAASKINSTLAEVYLAQGILYTAQNDPGHARAAFASATTSPGAPGWLIAEARALSSKGSSQQ